MDFSALPAPLRDSAARRWRELDAGALPDELAARLAGVLGWSGFVADVLRAQPELLHGEWAARLTERLPDDELAEALRARILAAADESALMRELRRARQSALARIAVRDMLALADLDETLRQTSLVAEACIDAALTRLHEWQRATHGEARDARGRAQQLIVLGMGKLGGRELNFSSDIDLIFAFDENGESDGPRPLSNEQYFTRLGRKLIRVLDEVTADGFAYRVDMRLRPFGDSGPLVMTANGVESYYEQHGREWERYAFVKARPVAGDLAAGDALLKRLQPFVYRRYLDFGVFESLREMKAAINAEVRRRELRNHVKLGPGGIREAEFVVQLFQLIRGGREPALRKRGFSDALDAAMELACLDRDDGRALARAYAFLRRLENRLQQAADAQAHEVPDPGPSRDALAASLGFATTAAFEAEWESHRQVVRRLFDRAFLGPEPVVAAEPLDAVWNDPEQAEQRELRSAGFENPAAAAAQLQALKERVERQPPGTHGLRRLKKLMPRVIAAAARQAFPDAALARMLKLIEAVLGRTTYLALLLENPRALEHLARVCSASDWIAQLVARHPVLLDELIDPRLFEDAPTRATLREDLAAHLSRCPAGDLEALMDALREFQQVSVMRVAAADIAGRLPVMQVSDRLTDVAELVIGAVLDSAEAHLVNRHGEPRYVADGTERRARFLVVGYGKLGGLELGYGSDLDLVFLHDSRGERQQTDGARPLDNAVFFLRLTQRLIHLLSTPTAAGVLYEVDTRLRPSGQAGLLVSSMEAFEKYQRGEAWTWEHQALLRARPVAGDRHLAEAFRRLRQEVLTAPRDAETLRRDVAEMRRRMRGGRAAADGLFDLKAGKGGITDIEFLAQYWVLREAHAAPELLEFTDTIRFLEGLESGARVPDEQLDGLVDAYRELRQAAHALALAGREALAPEAEHATARERVVSVWHEVFGDLDAAAGEPAHAS